MIFAGCQRDSGISDIIEEHIEKYPEMHEQDAIKIIYQAAMGNRHMLDDTAAARNYLNREFSSIKPDDKEELIEEISPDNSIVRINLRKFKAGGYSLDRLFEVMLVSAIKHKENPAEFNEYFDQLLDINCRKNYFSSDTLKAIFHRCEKSGYAAIHHSSHYMNKYSPSYRIVDRNAFRKEFSK